MNISPTKTRSSVPDRCWEIDVIRGLGILMMIVFHFFFDLDYFNLLKNDMYSSSWLVFQRTTATMILLVVGICLALCYNKHNGEKDLFEKYYLKRGLLLFLIALLITIGTWIYPNKGFIIFGVIHFIALSTITGYFFLRFFYLNLVLGIWVIFAGLEMGKITVSTNLLIWLGLSYPGFYALDYFPVFPWFGIILIGIFIGKYFYKDNKSIFGLDHGKNFIINSMNYLGRNSIKIYLVHQPILITIIQTYLYLIN
ncbi:MAG: heparan-alpha-glucosaminide N-acetyltransferase [Candidatus Micrarchaeota archaeon]